MGFWLGFAVLEERAFQGSFYLYRLYAPYKAILLCNVIELLRLMFLVAIPGKNVEGEAKQVGGYPKFVFGL